MLPESLRHEREDGRVQEKGPFEQGPIGWIEATTACPARHRALTRLYNPRLSISGEN
jgi:hypothetical protein